MSSIRIAIIFLAFLASLSTALIEYYFSLGEVNSAWFTGIIVFVINILLFFTWLEFFVLKNIVNAYSKVSDLLATTTKIPTYNTLHSPQDLADKTEKLVDIQQKEIERLRKLETFREEFVANVSHELKTPIFAAQGFVHTLLDGCVDNNDVRESFLKKAAKSLDDLSTLVEDILTLSQIETGGITMKIENIDLLRLCIEVVKEFQERMPHKTINIEKPDFQAFIIVRADWLRIIQVMNNLIFNAIKHTSDKGEITIHFSIDNEDIITHVSDTGEGIASQYIDRIFERFYRVEKSRNREKGGTGLGLAIVKHILERHATKIEVSSELGNGSKFSFKLPLAKDSINDFKKNDLL